MGTALGAPTFIAEFMPRLRETALKARGPSPNADHGRGQRRWKRALSPSKKRERKIISGWRGNHARSASSRRRYYAVRIVRRRRRSPSARDRDNLSCVTGQASNRTRASSETKIVAPRQYCRRCRTAVELSFAVTECARLARECILHGMWAAPKLVRGAGAGAEKAGERKIPSWGSDVYVVSL